MNEKLHQLYDNLGGLLQEKALSIKKYPADDTYHQLELNINQTLVVSYLSNLNTLLTICDLKKISLPENTHIQLEQTLNSFIDELNNF